MSNADTSDGYYEPSTPDDALLDAVRESIRRLSPVKPWVVVEDDVEGDNEEVRSALRWLVEKDEVRLNATGDCYLHTGNNHNKKEE